MGGNGFGDEEKAEDKGHDENHKFEGNDVGLFASAEYDKEDKVADAMWGEIDKRMELRRKQRRDARLKEETEKYRASNLKIKRKLVRLSASEWDGIPVIGDSSLRNKKKRFKSYVPMTIFDPDVCLIKIHDQAKKVLNKEREKFPKEPKIWIEAAKLEEAFGNTSMVGKIIERGIRALRKEGVEIVREAWMKEAEAAERAGSLATCNAIVSNTLGIGVEEEVCKATWDAEAEECKKRGSIETARAICNFAITRQLKLLSLGKEENAAEDIELF